jgi:putative ABC transport system permease protein
MTLTNDHIDYIIKDLSYRGIIAEEIQNELIDHVCSAVEKEMESGKRFIDAYHSVLKSFGHTTGLRQTQRETIQLENQKVKIMLRNYFTIALRNLNKNRFYTAINISGLAVGIASCLIIVLFVMSELGYDKHHSNADRIYRINGEIKFGGSHYLLAVAPAPLAEVLVQEFPEVESAVRFRSRGSYLVKASETSDNIKEDNVIWADSSFFKIFTVPVLQGNSRTALKEPNSVAISQKIANKFFPDGHALGQTLILDNRWPMTVTAVFADMPKTGHFKFDILISMSGLDEAKGTNFLSNNFQTYILLKAGTDARALETKLPAIVIKYIGAQAAQMLGGEFTMDKFVEAGNKLEYTLIPLTDIHLHSDRPIGELGPNGDIAYVYLFSAVALLILVIACINFMNLSTARSANRAKEVGVRKVMGSLRSHLIRQFLTESILLSVLSFVIAVALAYSIVPIFNELSQKSLVLPFSTPLFYLVLFVGSLVVGMMAGLYPSFFLSAFKPVQVLKGQVALGMKSGLVRSSLVVFQFMISIFLIVGTITVYRQLDFIQHKKIGFEKDQVLIVHDAYALGDKTSVFKDEIKKNSFILNGTATGYIPVNGWRNDNTYWPEGGQPTQDNMVGMQTWGVDLDYIKTFGMKMMAGRFFSPEFPSDSQAVVLNESAVRQYNFEQNPIGKKISTFTDNNPDGSPDMNSMQSWEVVGVVEDFHFESLKQNIAPLAFFLDGNNGSVAFRFQAKNTQDVISTIEKTWKTLAPGQPFQYSFLDEDFANLYTTEQRLGKTFAVFASLAIIIACLGLFALTAFTAEQRTKEIGVRKVLGASVSSIVVLLSKEFGKLVLIAFVLATPFAWWAVNKWLEDYQYKVEIGWTVFGLAGIIALAIAWLTMSYQSIKAATSNPVKSLRNE